MLRRIVIGLYLVGSWQETVSKARLATTRISFEAKIFGRKMEDGKSRPHTCGATVYV
jgi:hypothetical protein